MPRRMLLGVRLLQSLRDLLQPAQLEKARATDDHPARECEPRLERPAEEPEPGRARRVDLRSGSLHVGYLSVQLPCSGLELDRAADVREAEKRPTGVHILQRVAHGVG